VPSDCNVVPGFLVAPFGRKDGDGEKQDEPRRSLRLRLDEGHKSGRCFCERDGVIVPDRLGVKCK